MTTIAVKRKLRERTADDASARISRLAARLSPGTSALRDLVRVLALEQFERDLFRGESRDIGMPQVFGGQVLSQALTAAYATVQDRTVHSLHAYFLRRGDVRAPIVYQVERTRDGSSFSSRRAIATQRRRAWPWSGVPHMRGDEPLVPINTMRQGLCSPRAWG